jgi:tRNA pseudouridine38-40 synthase
MKNIQLIVAYDGTDYHGFQRQPHKKTIQGTIEAALSRLTREEIQIVGSGRTDRGVHALGQVCHFLTDSPIPAEKYASILRDQLPRDILVLSSQEVSLSFHAQKDAYWKTYRYQMETHPIPNLFERRYFTHLPYPLDHESMQRAAHYLVGTHDFTSFCSAKTQVNDRTRTIYDCKVKATEQKVSIEVTGSGFLYNMVRILAGTLYLVGRRKLAPEQISNILKARDRQLAGPTLPPEGLVLVRVGYQPWREDCNEGKEN